MYDYQFLEAYVTDKILDETIPIDMRMISLVTKACTHLGYKEEQLNHIVLGIYLKDIGIHTRRNVPIQYERHTLLGRELLDGIDGIEMIQNIVLLHHENEIGTGFPYGIDGVMIPEYVKIVSICNDYISYLDKQEKNIEIKLKETHNHTLVEFLLEHIFI